LIKESIKSSLKRCNLSGALFFKDKVKVELDEFRSVLFRNEYVFAIWFKFICDLFSELLRGKCESSGQDVFERFWFIIILNEFKALEHIWLPKFEILYIRLFVQEKLVTS